MRPSRVVCGRCNRLTDGLEPGIYAGTIGRLLGSQEQVSTLEEHQIVSWTRERNERMKRRRLQKYYHVLSDMASDLQSVTTHADRSLSTAFASYFDCQDALETLEQEIDILKTTVESVRDNDVEIDMRATDRAHERLTSQLDDIFSALTKVSDAMDRVSSRDNIEEVVANLR